MRGEENRSLGRHGEGSGKRRAGGGWACGFDKAMKLERERRLWLEKGRREKGWSSQLSLPDGLALVICLCCDVHIAIAALPVLRRFASESFAPNEEDMLMARARTSGM